MVWRWTEAVVRQASVFFSKKISLGVHFVYLLLGYFIIYFSIEKSYSLSSYCIPALLLLAFHFYSIVFNFYVFTWYKTFYGFQQDLRRLPTISIWIFEHLLSVYWIPCTNLLSLPEINPCQSHPWNGCTPSHFISFIMLLMSKLRSFHRWSWFLRWGSKSPLIILVKT